MRTTERTRKPVMVETASLRDAYGKIITEIGRERDDFVVLVADSASGTGVLEFKKIFPGRVYNFGIAEQDMMSAAGGMASVGLTCFVSTYGVFASMRAADQVRNSIAYPCLNVKLVISHVGFDAGEDGASHQAVEDLAVMRAIPNMKVFIPADTIELEGVLRAVLDDPGPAYVRTTRYKVPVVYPENYRFRIGVNPVLRQGNDVTIAAAGVMVHKALQAADILAKEGVAARVIDMVCLKPLDEKTLLTAAEETGGIVTVEDASVIGGVGGAVAELLAKKRPARMEMVGIPDVFGETGSQDVLYERYHMAPPDIAAACRRVVDRK